MGKFSWDDRDPFEGFHRRKRDHWMVWFIFLATVATIVVAGWAIGST